MQKSIEAMVQNANIVSNIFFSNISSTLIRTNRTLLKVSFAFFRQNFSFKIKCLGSYSIVYGGKPFA